MCFGGSKETGKTTTETNSKQKTKLPEYLNEAAKWNVNNTLNMAQQPYEAFTGDRVAPINADMMASYDAIRALASTSNPYTAEIESLYRSLGNIGQGIGKTTVQGAPTILGGDYDVRSGTIRDYMNPYIDAVLSAQMREIMLAEDQARNRNASAAVMEGAFGDARNGVVDSELNRNVNQLRADTVGKAYSNAFDVAANLRRGDITNILDVDKTNAALNEASLNRTLQSQIANESAKAAAASGLISLDKYDTGRDLDLASKLNIIGEQQKQTDQAQLNADYEAYLREQSWGPEMAKLLTSITAGTPYEKTIRANSTQTKTETAPDNSGWGMLGSIAGQALPYALAPFTGGASLAMAPLGAALGTAGSMFATGGTGAMHTPGSYSAAFPMPI